MGLFSKGKSQLVGLDIGSHAVKLVEIEDTKRRYKLKSVGIAYLPPNAIVEGALKNPEIISSTIKNLVKANKIKEKNVATSISGYSVIIKKIDLARMDEEKLVEKIPVEAEQFIPYNIEDVNLDFQILPDSDPGQERMDVMLVAAKKDIIDDYTSLLRNAGLYPQVIDVDFFALENAFDISFEPSPNVCTALIDIGAGKININVLKGNVSMFTRDASIGGRQITQDIQDKFGLDYNQAEEIKLGKTGDIRPDELEDIFISATTSWSAEVKRAIDFFYATYPDEEISQIQLSGGSARLPGLDMLLSKDTGIDVAIFNPLAYIDYDAKSFDPEYLDFIGPQLAIAVGLAIRRV